MPALAYVHARCARLQVHRHATAGTSEPGCKTPFGDLRTAASEAVFASLLLLLLLLLLLQPPAIQPG